MATTTVSISVCRTPFDRMSFGWIRILIGCLSKFCQNSVTQSHLDSYQIQCKFWLESCRNPDWIAVGLDFARQPRVLESRLHFCQHTDSWILVGILDSDWTFDWVSVEIYWFLSILVWLIPVGLWSFGLIPVGMLSRVLPNPFIILLNFCRSPGSELWLDYSLIQTGFLTESWLDSYWNSYWIPIGILTGFLLLFWLHCSRIQTGFLLKFCRNSVCVPIEILIGFRLDWNLNRFLPKLWLASRRNSD